MRTHRISRALRSIACAIVVAWCTASGVRGQAPAAHPAHSAGELAGREALTRKVDAKLGARPTLEVSRQNYVDDYIFEKMAADHVRPARLTNDAEFLRRVTLDLTGRIPSSEKVRMFLAEKSPDKRTRIIDSLIFPERYSFQDEDPFVDRWTYWLGDLFGNSAQEIGTEGRNIFHDYLRMCLRLNVPYNRMVSEMLTATALTNWLSGPANFLARFHVDDATGNQISHEDTCDEIAIASSRIFLGVNAECISCHDGSGHLEKINLWLSQRKREELWRQAAFLGNLTIYRPPPRRQEYTVLDRGPGYDAESNLVSATIGYNVEAPSVVRTKRWKADVTPAFLLTGERSRPNEDPRHAFARILTENPQFARASVNWIWAELMGVGIVDPPDGFDLARQDPRNPPPPPWSVQPTHPELLERLAKDFSEHGFDLRYLIRLIVSSSAYQLSSQYESGWKPEYARYFARHLVRRLPAEQLFDAISQATGIYPSIPIQGATSKVKYVMQTRSPDEFVTRELLPIGRFLVTFGQTNRTRAPRNSQGDPVQASALLNSGLIRDKVLAAPGSRLHQLLNQEPALSNEQLVEELFLSVLCRFPTPSEGAVAVRQLQEYRTQGAEDLMWALLNKLDFIFNY